MNIKELKEKYKDSKPDTILERETELEVKVKKALNIYEIVIEDETSSMEASTSKIDVLKKLRELEKSDEKVRIKGFLMKTEYEDVGFEIEEIASC